MTVTLNSLATGVIRTQSDQSAKLSAALATRASATATSSSTNTPASVTDIDNLDTTLQSQALSLRIDSLNVGYVSTKIDNLDTGSSEVSRILGQLQSLATQASAGGLSNSALELINGQFQALRISINNVPPPPPGAQYSSSGILDGLSTGTIQPTTPSQSGQSADGETLLGGFSDTRLLGNSNLLSTAAAQQTLATIQTASSQIDAQQQTLATLKTQVEFVAASNDSAVQNQAAAQSTLSDDDLTGEANVSLQASLQAQPALAQAAQTSRLPNNILQLLAQ